MASAIQLQGLGRAAPLPSQRRKLHFASRRAATLRIVCQASDHQTGVTSFDAAANPGMAAPLPPAYPMPVPVPHNGVEGSTSVYAPPPGYPYQMPARPGQEYYLTAPSGYYAAPPPPMVQETSSGLPWFVWVGIGIVGATIFNKVQEFMKNPKTPQQMMTEMAMKQMMGQMNKGGSPFPAGMPPFPGGMPPGFPPAGFPQPPATGSTVDVASTPSESTGSPADNGNGSTKKGEKFASRYGQSSTATSSATTTPTTEESTAKPASNMDVVEPIVKEPTSSSSSSSSQSTRKSSSSFFADAASQSQPKQSSSSSSSSSSANGSANTKSDGSVMMEMMETMLRNPDMQKMLYPYLPEPMRNPQSIEWMLNNPEVKKQMAETFEQQNMMSPQMMEMMRSMNINQDQVNRQFQELGMKPEDVIQKLMANPEVAAGFQNPKVQAAIMDISQNPMNVIKYQSDPEIMKVLNHVSGLFENDIKMK